MVDKGPGWFAVDVSGETQARTAAGQWEAGRKLNLERALKLGDELGGHIVTGHVDGVGEVVGVCPEGDSRRIGFAVPAALAPYLAPKGSITVDGVSLTVNEVADRTDGTTHFSINIIPHTAAVTTLGALGAGDSVNLEIDVLARYLEADGELSCLSLTSRASATRSSRAPKRSSTRRRTAACSSSSTTRTARMRATSSSPRRWRRPTRSTSWRSMAAG